MLVKNSRIRNMVISIFLMSLFFIAAISTPSLGQKAAAALPAKEDSVTARLIADTSAIQPGKSFRLGVELTMQPGWHTYYKEPGDAGMATKIDWVLPAGFTAKPLKWEKPSRFDDGGIVSYVYSVKTVIAAEIQPPKQISNGSINLAAKVRWLSCHDICVPGGAEVKLVVPVASASDKKVSAVNVDSFKRADFDGPVSEVRNLAPKSAHGRSESVLDDKLTIVGASGPPMSLFGYLALAFIGGFILNFMPCVLPVVAIKIVSLLEQADKNKTRVRLLGIAFSAGILSSFLLLAALVVGLQAAGQKIGWGFQFQYPPFVLTMATIVLLFALSLLGQFNLAITLGQKEVGDLAEKEGLPGTFFKGVLATILSTPCTAPFLGTALGFAFVEPWWTICSVFFVIGLGMASPYLLLTFNPDWMKFLPRPGVWMEKLKEAFGFVLLATTVWLVSILGDQVGIAGLVQTLYFLLTVAIAVWIVSRFSSLSSTPTRVFLVRGIAIAVAGLAFYFFIFSQPGLLFPGKDSLNAGVTTTPTPTATGEVGWQPFSVGGLNAALNSGKTVFLDFSAKWCLTCQVNEGTVLRSKEIEDKFKALHVVVFQADWTNQDPSITTLLRKFGRSGVPLYVIFPAKSPDHPIVLPEIINKSLVLEKLDEAGASLSSDK